MRMHGHGAHDDMSYVPPELFEEWSARDPIDRYRERLASEHGFAEDELDGIEAEVEREVGEARRARARVPHARPRASPREGVFADSLRGARRRRGPLVALERGFGARRDGRAAA